MRITYKGRVTGETFWMGLYILFDGFAPGLFFAFNQHFDIDRQCPIDGHQRIQRLKDQHGLPLIVARATAVEIAVTNSWLEGGRIPLFDWIDRLYIIVAVNQDSRLTSSFEPLAIDQRMTLSCNNLHICEA